MIDLFLQQPSVGLGLTAVRHEPDPDRAFTMFRMMLMSRDIDMRVFQTMMTYCKQRAPAKAPAVFDRALMHGVDLPLSDGFFCTYLGACQRATPIPLDNVLQRYRRVGPRTHNVIFGMANICRVARKPEAALFLVWDAVSNKLVFTEKLLSLFAACCAESHSKDGADTAKYLLSMLCSKRIATFPNVQLFANLVKAVLDQARIDSALKALALMDILEVPPSEHIFTMVLSSLVRTARLQQSLAVYRTMAQRGIPVFHALLPSLIALCGRHSDLAAVQDLHRYADARSLLSNDYVACALISAYDKCQRPDAAEQVFLARFAVSTPDEALFTAMVSSYCHHGMLDSAAGMFAKLKASGQVPTQAAYTVLLWGLCRGKSSDQALALFRDMLDQKVPVSPAVFSLLVGACANAADVDNLYQYARATPLLDNDRVVGAFIGAYARLHKADVAGDVFHSVASPGTDAFSAIIDVSVAQRRLPDVFDLVGQAAEAGVPLQKPTMAAVVDLLAELPHCDHPVKVVTSVAGHKSAVRPGHLARLSTGCGRRGERSSLIVLHQLARDRALLGNDDVARALVSAFSAAGDLDSAKAMFGERSAISTPDVATCDAMLAALSLHGTLPETATAFDDMTSAGMRPSTRTLTSLLRACARARDPSRADALLREFADVWDVPLSGEHVRCIVDLHGRIGNVDDAERIASAQLPRDAGAWLTVLRACRKHKDVARAERALSALTALPGVTSRQRQSAFSLVVDVYRAAGRTDDAERLRGECRSCNLPPGDHQPTTTLHLQDRCVQVSDALYESDPGLRECHRAMVARLVENWHPPNLPAAPDHDACQRVRPHSAELALACGLISNDDSRCTIRLTQDAILCSDCHQVAKTVSQVYATDAYIRDDVVHHHFSQGHCSCDDYW